MAGGRIAKANFEHRTTTNSPSSIISTFSGCAPNKLLRSPRARTLSGTALYLDFPLGVNRDGYDVWRERDLFALGINGGAPPDGLFIKGQNWGFPPLQPEAIRQQGYRYYIECLRHHMGSGRHAAHRSCDGAASRLLGARWF